MREVASGATQGAAAETVATFVAGDPVERGVDDSPVVLVGFRSYQPGNVEFTFASPLIEEVLPLLLHDAIDEKPTSTTIRCTTVLVTTTLVASHQRGTDPWPHTDSRADKMAGANELLRPRLVPQDMFDR